MTTYTSRGIPILEATDSADIPGRVNPLAQLFHDRPGVATLTATQRNALTGSELWHGRVIVNTTIDRLQRYQLSTNTWFDIADFSEIAALLATTGTPLANGTASRGTSSSAARSDHVHPVPTWQSFTPTWSASGTAPSIGNGTNAGSYFADGKHITVRYDLTAGSTTNFGSGVYRLSLPVAAAVGVGHGFAGWFYLEDSGSSGYGLFARTVSTTTVEFVYHSITTPGLLANTWQNIAPFTFGQGDFLRGELIYQAA